MLDAGKLARLEWLLFTVLGFVAAQLLVNLGVRARVGGFKIEHLYVGFLLMLAGFFIKKAWLFYLGLGVAINDFVIDWGAGAFQART
ncbi:hypothetical protein HY546_03415 [archaeon]|nr:hypothetical protein [archaeon]